MDNFTAESIRISLKSMFQESSSFDICVVRKCLRAAGITAPKQEIDTLRVLHCVKWGEMTPEMRMAVMERTVRLFETPQIDIPSLDTPMIGESDTREGDEDLGFFKRLISSGKPAYP